MTIFSKCLDGGVDVVEADSEEGVEAVQLCGICHLERGDSGT